MPDPAPNTPPQPARSNRRRIAWGVAFVSLAALIVSVALLGRAISAHQQREGRRQFYYKPLESTEFTLMGRPVRITQEVGDDGRGQVLVTYAQDTLRLDVQIPNRNALPLLIRQQDWFRMFVWADGTAMNAQEFAEARKTGERPEHVVIVTRSLGPGAPPGSWGDIWKDEWVFNFYTLVPPPPGAPPDVGGGFAHERWEYPESPRAFDRRVQAARLAGQPAPERDSKDLREDTWQYGAAMLVMPTGSAPAHTFNRGVLIENRAYVAIASVSILAIMTSLAIALAPRTRPSPPDIAAGPNANPPAPSGPRA